MRCIESTMASGVAFAAPTNPLPAPRAITGTPWRAAACRHRETWSVDRGNTTAAGECAVVKRDWSRA